MSPQDRLATRALDCFLHGGRSCGEAVVQAGCEALGIDARIVSTAAFGFCGGLGRQGQLCGAIAGGAMVISLAGTSTGPDEAQLDAVGELHAEMVRRHGDCSCRSLCGLDLARGGERLRFLAEGVQETRCAPVVDEVARLVARHLVACRPDGGATTLGRG